MPGDSLQKCHRIYKKTLFTKSHTDWIVNHNSLPASTGEANSVSDLKINGNNLIIFCSNCFLLSLVRYRVKMKTMQFDKPNQKYNVI